MRGDIPLARGDIPPSLESLYLEEMMKEPHPGVHVVVNHQVEEADDGPLGIGDQLHQTQVIPS